MATRKAAVNARETTLRPGPDTSETFTYSTSKGVIALPSVAGLPSSIVRKNRHDEGELVFATLEWGADSKSLAVLDELTQVELAEVFKMWQEDSRVSLGELLASLS